MAAGFFSFSACDTFSKLLTADFHPMQIVWMRTLALVIGILVLIALKGRHLLHSTRPTLQVLRGVMAVGSGALFIFAIKNVPLADAVAVTFVAPFIVTILGALILKEPVGIRRWLAVAIGFAGMLIVIRPGLGVFHPSIFLVFLAAVFFSFRQLISRWLSGTDPVITTVAYTSLTAFLLLSFAQPFVWSTPSSTGAVLMIIGLALTAAIGEILIIKALDIAHSVVLAPVHYTLIIWGTFYGFIVFGELPDGWTLVGCAIIVLSGLYTTYREYIKQQQ